MKKTPEQLNLEKLIRSDILSKFPLLGVTLNDAKFMPTDKVKSIETDGTDILYNTEYINNLTFDQQVFDFSHNLMHIQFNHVARSKGKDPTTWNYSTDAVINQILKHEGLQINGIDVSDAFDKSAEELYTQLINAKNSQFSMGKNGQPNSSTKTSSTGKDGQPSPNNQKGKQGEKQTQTDKSGQSHQDESENKSGSKNQQNNKSKQNNNSSQQQEESSANSQSQSAENQRTLDNSSQANGENQSSPSQSSANGNSATSTNSGLNSQYGNGTNNNSNSQPNGSSDEEFFQNYPDEQNGQGGRGGSGAQGSGVSQEIIDDFQDYQNNGNAEQHSNWNGRAKKMNFFEKIMQMLSKKQNEQNQQLYDEQKFTTSNQNLKNQQLQELTDYLSKKKKPNKKGMGENNDTQSIKDPLKRLAQSETLEEYMSPVEEGYVPVVDWKKYLKRNKEFRREEKLEYTWSLRRADEDSDWQSRLERTKLKRKREEDEKKPITLVTIDTSPSIPDELLKGFVNQLGELSKESRILVGCFYDHFCGFKEIVPDNNGHMYINLERGWGTDLDAACRSFKAFEKMHPEFKILNRIIFTDGDAGNGTKPSSDLWGTDCLWLIFDYPGTFTCCCGKVLQFKSKDLMKDINKERTLNLNNKKDEDKLILS